MVQIIFSGEKKFNLDELDGFAYYWWDLKKEQGYFSEKNFEGCSLIILENLLLMVNFSWS